MKKGSKIAVIIVFLLVIIFGVGQFFAFSNPGASSPNASSTTPTGDQTPATNIVAFVPNAVATSTPVQQGSCFGSSIAAPYRTDAWRCSVGNSISDPCFAIPGSKNLLCNINPSKPNSTSTFVLKPMQALPPAEPIPGPQPTNWAWRVQLADGTICAPFTGTRPFTAGGQSANYGCAPGPLGTDVYIFGDLNNAAPSWTANVGTLSVPTSTLPTITSSAVVPVATVWQ